MTFLKEFSPQFCHPHPSTSLKRSLEERKENKNFVLGRVATSMFPQTTLSKDRKTLRLSLHFSLQNKNKKSSEDDA